MDTIRDITRRLFLTRVVTAVPVVAAAGIPAVAVVALPEGVENPELIRLANELPDIENRYIAALEHRDAVLETWEPHWPLAPDEITRPGVAGAWGGFERTFDGGALRREGEERPRQLIPSSEFKWLIKNARRVLKGKKLGNGKVNGLNRAEWEAELAEAERLYTVAVEYEAEIARIAQEANYEPAWRAVHTAVEALEIHVSAIMDQPDITMQGLMIKAQALAAWGQVEGLFQVTLQYGHEWPAKIAESILQHAERHAPAGDRA